MAVEYKESSNLRYMDWNPYLHSVNNDLNVVNSLIPKCYELGKNNVRNLAINLQALYYSRRPFILNDRVINKINSIINKLHDPAFVKDYKEKKESALSFEYKCIHILLNECYVVIVDRLSKNKLIPEVEYTREEEIDERFKGMAT